MYLGHCLSAAAMFLGNKSISDWIFVVDSCRNTMSLAMRDSLRDDSSIECDDHGAEYIEGRVKCILSDILKNPDTEMLKQFLPAAIESNEAAIGSQLLVQASLSAWQLGSREVASPLFMGAFFPQMDLPVTVLPVRNENISQKENYAGNCLGYINVASMEDGDDQLELQGLVSRIRKELEDICRICVLLQKKK
ncbi:hypothetical protein Peur_018801 [Populus x canadensis]